MREVFYLPCYMFVARHILLAVRSLYHWPEDEPGHFVAVLQARWCRLCPNRPLEAVLLSKYDRKRPPLPPPHLREPKKRIRASKKKDPSLHKKRGRKPKEAEEGANPPAEQQLHAPKLPRRRGKPRAKNDTAAEQPTKATLQESASTAVGRPTKRARKAAAASKTAEEPAAQGRRAPVKAKPAATQGKEAKKSGRKTIPKKAA